MKKNSYTKDQIKYVKSLRDTLPSTTTSKLCRAMNNGMLPTCDGAMEYYKEKPGYVNAKPHDDLAYVKNDVKDNDILFVEVEGKKYALKLEKQPLHDPRSILMRS